MMRRLDHVKDTTGYWLHSTWTQPTLQSNLSYSEVLMDQGWPSNIWEAATTFCERRRFSFSRYDLPFTRTSGYSIECPLSPILFVLYSLPIITPSPQGASFTYMDDHAQLSWSRDPTQLALHAAFRVQSLHQKAGVLGLRVDPNKTEILYIPPCGAGSKLHKTDPDWLTLRSGDLTVPQRPQWSDFG